MSGHSRAHDEVGLTLALLIRGKLGVRAPCRVHQAGLQVRVEAAEASFYPDLHVTCDARDHAHPSVTRYSSLIIEILSPSTRDYDRGDKFSAYKCLDSLREYLLVDSQTQAVSLSRRVAAGRWLTLDVDPTESFELETIGLTLSVTEIYSETDVPLPRPRPRSVPAE